MGRFGENWQIQRKRPLTGKKSLPVLFGLEKGGPFSKNWRKGGISPDEVDGLAKQLEIEGGRDYTKKVADQFTQKALKALQNAKPSGDPGEALRNLSNQLLQRGGSIKLLVSTDNHL